MKVKPLRANAVRAARAVLAEARVRHPRDIHPEAIAGLCGAVILYGKMETASAALVRSGKRGVIRLDERFRGEPRDRFTTLHEAGHLRLHDDVDHFVHCLDERGTRKDGAWQVEEEANHFATEVSMPEELAAPLCTTERPTLEEVDKLTSVFRMSFSASGIRYVQLTKEPCALVLAQDGRVKWAVESVSFPGAIARRAALHEHSVATLVSKRRPGRDLGAREVPGGVWGTSLPLLEHAIPLGRGLGVMSWVTAAW